MLLWAGSSFLGLAALSACGGTATPAVSAATSSAAKEIRSTSVGAGTSTVTLGTRRSASAASPTAQSVQLTATNWSAVDIAAIYTKLVQEFEQQQPLIRVTYTPTSGDYWTKLLTEAAGGVLQDVFWMNAQNLGAWVAKGQLLDLTPLANRDKYNLQDFWPAKIAAATIAGHLMALPSQADDIGVFYNATLFQQANVTLPAATYSDQTWDRPAFLTACQRLTKRGGSAGAPGQFGCVAPMAFINYAPWIWANGGDFMNQERTASTVTGAATVEAFQFLQDLIHKYQVAPTPAQLSAQSGDTQFVTGKIGMTTNTISATTFYRKNATHFTWDAGAIPAGKGGFATLSAGPFWAVSAQSKHLDQAWALSKFLVSAPSQHALAQGGAEMPSLQSVATAVWQHPTQPPLHGASFLDGMDHVHPNPFVANWAQIENMLIKELSYLWDGSKTAHDVMQLIKPQMDVLIRQKPS